MSVDLKNVLPTSVPRETKGVQYHVGMNWKPIYCANCGSPGGFIPEYGPPFAFWLCNSGCAEKWGQLAGTMAIPDEVFWQKVKEEQLNQVGREMTNLELIRALDDESNPLTKLGKDRA